MDKYEGTIELKKRVKVDAQGEEDAKFKVTEKYDEMELDDFKEVNIEVREIDELEEAMKSSEMKKKMKEIKEKAQEQGMI